MKRGQVGDRIVYVERHGKLSFVCFLAAVGAVAVVSTGAFTSPEETLGVACVYGGMFLLCALVLQFRSRAFLIDPGQATLTVLERRFLLPVQRRTLPLAGLRVFTTSAENPGAFDLGNRLFWIWVAEPDRPRILFKGNLKDQARVHDLVVRLSEDLRRATAPLLPPDLAA